MIQQNVARVHISRRFLVWFAFGSVWNVSRDLTILGSNGLEEAEYSCIVIAEASRDKRSHKKPSEGPYVLIVVK